MSKSVVKAEAVPCPRGHKPKRAPEGATTVSNILSGKCTVLSGATVSHVNRVLIYKTFKCHVLQVYEVIED